jgi:ComF family protein
VTDRGTSGRQLSGWLADAGDALVSVLFPAECRLCERLLTRARRVPICDECLGSFTAMPKRVCEICGSPPEISFSASPKQPEIPSASDTDGVVCAACRVRTYGFDRARSYAAYDAALVRAILMLKFERIEPLGVWFAERLVEVVKREAQTMAADVVVPVPLHRERQRERGDNQADLIAKPLARRLGLPYRAVLLLRTRPRPDKHLLGPSERWESVRGAFATRPGSQVDNLCVLLVDDVMTTGAILDACAQALRGAGAKAVIGLTVARAARRHSVIGSDES